MKPPRLHEIFVMPSFEGDVRFLERGSEYPQAMTDHLVDGCLRQGLDLEFSSIFEQHLRDLNLLIGDGLQAPTSRIDVLRAKGENQENAWQRVVVLNRNELAERKEWLQAAFACLEIPQPKPDDEERYKEAERAVEATALDWLFYEQVVDVLNSACFMQRTYGKYIHDFNGVSPHFQAELTISTAYQKAHPEIMTTLRNDYERFKAGFGLMFLRDALLAKGVFAHAQQADWLINLCLKNGLGASALNDKPIMPFKTEEVAAHLQIIKPERDGAGRLREFVMSHYDPELDGLDEE